MDLNVIVYALSLDDVHELGAFAEAQELNFQLLSDPDGSAAQKFGVLGSRGWANRVTYVVDPQGAIRHVDTAVNVDAHGSDLVGVVRKLQED
jgi:peroxiredoxin Q/BCP